MIFKCKEKQTFCKETSPGLRDKKYTRTSIIISLLTCLWKTSYQWLNKHLIFIPWAAEGWPEVAPCDWPGFVPAGAVVLTTDCKLPGIETLIPGCVREALTGAGTACLTTVWGWDCAPGWMVKIWLLGNLWVAPVFGCWNDRNSMF